jgi:hypothetical protein
VGCLFLLGICVLGIIIMIAAVTIFGSAIGLAISTFADMAMLGGWLFYLWRQERRIMDED